MNQCQAVGDNSEGCLRWHIITPNNTGLLSEYFAKKGKSLESEGLVPEPDELLEATKASIPILRCDQSVGDVVYIPPRSWYQVSYGYFFHGSHSIDELEGHCGSKSYQTQNLARLSAEGHSCEGHDERYRQAASVSGTIKRALQSKFFCAQPV
jgi:hypothetical protein